MHVPHIYIYICIIYRYTCLNNFRPTTYIIPIYMYIFSIHLTYPTQPPTKPLVGFDLGWRGVHCPHGQDAQRHRAHPHSRAATGATGLGDPFCGQMVVNKMVNTVVVVVVLLLLLLLLLLPPMLEHSMFVYFGHLSGIPSWTNWSCTQYVALISCRSPCRSMHLSTASWLQRVPLGFGGNMLCAY